jgi:hypothetical protein
MNWLDLPIEGEALQANTRQPQAGGIDSSSFMQPTNNRNSLIEALLPAVRQVESGGNDFAVSPSGAKGPWQFMDATADDVAKQLNMPSYDIFTEKDAEPMARHYLSTLYDRYEDPELALAAYNYGMGNIDKRLKDASERSFNAIADTLPKETRNYVPKVMGLLGDALVPSVQAEEPSSVAKPNSNIVDKTPKTIASNDSWLDLPIDEGSDIKPPVEGIPTEVLPPDSFSKELLRQVGQGATFNFGDELGLIDKSKSDQFEKEHPYYSMGAQMAGGAIAPLALALMAPAAPATGLGALAAGAGRVALGSGVKNAAPSMLGRIGQGIVSGAVPSAISGAGDAEEGQKIAGALAGGAFGGGLGGAIGLASEVIRSQVGKLTPELKSLARRLTGYGDEELAQASSKLAEAKTENSPFFLTEAIDKPEFTAQAKAIARKDNTAEIARTALKERQSGQYDRISDIADTISPVRSSDEATSLVVDKAKAIQQGLKDARESAANPLYAQAYRENPTIDSEGLASLLEIPRVSKSVKKVQLDAPDLPANSTKLLDEVLADLKETAGTLKASNEPRASRRVMETSSKLESELEKIIPLKQARETFAEMSIPINKLKKAGFDKILKDEYGETVAKEGFTATQLGQQLLSERTKIADVRRLKEAFGGDDEPIKAAVRAHVQDLFDRKIDGYDISNVLNTPKFKKKLNVLVGEKDAGRLLNRLEREIKISETNKALRVGSDTAGNIEGSIKEDLNRMNWIQALGSDPVKMAGMVVKAIGDNFAAPKPETFQDEARIIFSRDSAQKALDRIVGSRGAINTYDERYRKLLPLLNALSRGGYGNTELDGE